MVASLLVWLLGCLVTPIQPDRGHRSKKRKKRYVIETTVETQPARYVRDGQPTGKGVRAHAQTPFCDFGNRRSAQRLVTGRLPASAVAAGLHFGCPQPLTLTPSCWPA